MEIAAVETGAGRFIDYTHVLWLDGILNAGMLLNLVGFMLWIVWGFRERRHGIRGALRKTYEKSPHANGWKPRTRWILAGGSAAVAVGLLILGAALSSSGRAEGHAALTMGGVWAGLWLLAGPLLRPVAGERPRHSQDWAGPEDRGGRLSA
ncbi:hypothetical protein ABZ858_34675 [Streptomyces sp. NPDC047017]|uniref:hypothetical protein n=1 Tax=Streptomyces sp. NPDC047017 TaxID=3155024 RepID=UPI0033C85F41